MDFQNDIKDPTKRVSQIDYAQSYQYEMQNEIISALWTRGSVNLFTCAVYNNSQTKTLAFRTNYKGKDKISSMLFYWNPVERTHPTQWNCPGTNNLVRWCHISSKTVICETWIKSYLQFTTNLLRKFKVTAHDKGVVDGVGGRVKSLVHKKSYFVR